MTCKRNEVVGAIFSRNLIGFQDACFDLANGNPPLQVPSESLQTDIQDDVSSAWENELFTSVDGARIRPVKR